jgi:hypothetical protein
VAGHHGRSQQLIAARFGTHIGPSFSYPLRGRERCGWQQQDKGRKSAAHHGDLG